MKLDKNGYGPSLFDTEPGRCYLCKRYTETIRHEVFGGTGTRAQSKKYGLWVNICPACHEEVHRFRNEGKDEKLKEEARRLYGKDDFTDRFITGSIKWWEE